MPKRSILDELRAPFESDPFYEDLERFAEERDLALPTVHLEPGELDVLRELVKQWSDGEPVAGVIEQFFAIEITEGVKS